MIDISEYFWKLNNNPGVYGIFSVPGMEKAKLLSYISNLYVLKGLNRPMIITLEMSELKWRKDMTEWGLQTNGVLIEDDLRLASPEKLDELVNKTKPSIIMIHYLSLMYHNRYDIIVQLDQISQKYEIPIIIEGTLGRSTGDKDLMYRRPELFDIVKSYEKKMTLNQFLDEYNAFHSIILMHRNHDCERRLGGASRYNVGSMAELKVYNRSECFSIYFDFKSLFRNYRYSEIY